MLVLVLMLQFKKQLLWKVAEYKMGIYSLYELILIKKKTKMLILIVSQYDIMFNFKSIFIFKNKL